MLIARVVGDVTATIKHPSHEGCKILLVQPLDLDGTDRGNPVVAIDSVNAGIGERVLLVQDGYAAFTAAGHKLAPMDAAVIGIIDNVELTAPLQAPAVTPEKPAKTTKKRRS